MGFPARLIQLREDAKLTQGELAKLSGVPRASIANLEQGRRKPTLDAAQKLANALGVDCTAFTFDSNEDAEEVEKRGRGRPKKVKDEPEVLQAPKKRGRPRKVN